MNGSDIAKNVTDYMNPRITEPYRVSPKVDRIMTEITEKDVYGQEPVFPEPVTREEAKAFWDKIDSQRIVGNYKPHNKMKTILSILRVLLGIVMLPALAFAIVMCFKILYSVGEFVWGLW